jgi:hypothetical protein
MLSTRCMPYTSVRRYLESSETGLIVWTLAVQDPRHGEEQETWISLSID